MRKYRNVLKDILSKQIKDTVNVHLIGKDLLVEIDSGVKPFRYIVRHLSREIEKGLSVELLSEVILKLYKNFILSIYFIDIDFDK